MYHRFTPLGAALIFLLQTVDVSASCGSAAVPLGDVVCVEQTGQYAARQWATCISSEYMRQKSKNRHSCGAGPAAVCYYQCMQEVYDVDNGTLSKDCSCEPGEATTVIPTALLTTEPGPTLTPLDPQCYSPSGGDCLWYGDCLERRIPCSGERDGDVTLYAQTFCSRFEMFRNRLSGQGHDWMDATRKCLQVSMVPSLRPFENQTCSNLKRLASRAYRDCYMNPFPGAPSLCDLSIYATWNLFWILKEPLASDFHEALFELYELAMQCPWHQSNSAYGTTILMKVELYIGNAYSGQFSKAATDGSIVEVRLQYHILAAELTATFASRLGWSQKGLIWFAFGQMGEHPSLVDAYILLADKRSYDLQLEPLDNDRTTDWNSLFNATSSAFAGGSLNVINLGGHGVQLMSLTFCGDDACKNSTSAVQAPLNGSDATRVSNSLLRVLVMLVFLRKLFLY